MVDENTQAINDGEEASELVKKMLEFCTAFHRQSLATREFVDELETFELLCSGTVTVSNESWGSNLICTVFRLSMKQNLTLCPMTCSQSSATRTGSSG